MKEENILVECSQKQIGKYFVRVDMAADLFSLSKSHIWSLIANNQLQAFRPTPKVTLLKVSDITNYIENNSK